MEDEEGQYEEWAINLIVEISNKALVNNHVRILSNETQPQETDSYDDVSPICAFCNQINGMSKEFIKIVGQIDNKNS